MPQTVAGLYELKAQIGAGGGGVVYLGRHIRLDKDIVLKADKRSLTAGEEALRREVDMLKGLSQTYIPQVYDFVQEDGIVYTVMDYIPGESMDRLLDRNGRLPQAQVVGWACQLLEALEYLHGRLPHGILHGDIKPANIMLRPDGTICLIDFNIALALGEDGAVKVGFSRGYASPEHYGTEYVSGRREALMHARADRKKAPEDGTVTMAAGSGAGTETVSMDTGSRPSSGSTGRPGNAVLLDVRSDIYSLGATLYHMLSGRRPAQDAAAVEVLGPADCSPAVAAIIAKAMAPLPEERYQTAAQMREAFLNLHRTDIRMIRHRRRAAVSAAVLAAVFLAGGAGTFVGLKQLEQRQAALTLSEYSANALAQGDVVSAVSQALQAIPSGESILEAPVTAQAQKALTDALGVYDLSDGFKAAGTIGLPGAPFDISVSPEGTRLAVVYGYEAAVYELADGSRTAVLPVQESALSDCLFTDESHVVCAGQEGVTLYDLEAQRTVWTGREATTLAVSADGSTVAAVDRDADYAVIYSAEDGRELAECSFEGLRMAVAANDIFADPKDAVFALNGDGSLLAVSFSQGGLKVFDLRNREDDLIIYDASGYRHFEGGFSGNYFAFAADGDGALFGLVDTAKAASAGGLESQERFLLRTDEDGIYLGNGNVLVELETSTLEELEIAYTGSVEMTNFAVGKGHALVATEDNGFSFYDSGAHLMTAESGNQNADFLALTEKYAVIGNRTETSLRILELESHGEAQLFAYDARYAHDEARISADGRTAVLFDHRGFRIYDSNGELVAETELPDVEKIYDQQFRREGEDSYLEVIWYDGTRRFYSAADGSVISEETGEAPAKDLYEEFFVGGFRIASGLHDAPVVYDAESGAELAVLESDGYLTYVTEVGDYLITEYMDTAGGRYGLLLNRRFEVLALLPGLCDVSGDRLVFDDKSGNLRQSRLYSLRELIALGEAYTG